MGAIVTLAGLTVLSVPASAELVVTLDGTGQGSVESVPKAAGGGIECTNVGGEPSGPFCSDSFPLDFGSAIALTATPGAKSYFVGWTGDDIDGFGRATCNSGDANPCMTDDYEEFFPGTVTMIAATFDALPDPPGVVSGGVGPGEEQWLRTLGGMVNPGGFAVERCYFEYGQSRAYGKTAPCVGPDASELGEGGEPIEVSAETEPLNPGKIYHFRLVATNIGGTAHGPDGTFKAAAFNDSCGRDEGGQRRAEQGISALLLPNCMALEMATPAQKNSVPARYPNVNADGSRVSFRAQAALGADPPALFGKVTYVATRGDSGWSSASTVPSLEPRLGGIWSAAGSDFRPSFAPDFSRWFGIGASEQQLSLGTASAYDAGIGDFFLPLSEPQEPLSSSSTFENLVVFRSTFQGASADRSHLYFQPGERAIYVPGDPVPFGPSAENANVYLAHIGATGHPAPLELLQRDLEGVVWGGRCGARLGGIGRVGFGAAQNGERNQGAVSADGFRTYFSARAAQPQEGDCDGTNKLRILERLETASGPQIAPLLTSECSRPASEPCSTADGDDLYQGASLDQTKVYFTSNRQLADADIDGTGAECDRLIAVAGCDLYLYDHARSAGERLVQVSAGEDIPGEHEVGVDAKVFNGITAISADGSHVYFVAEGVLTAETNPEGATAQLGQPNLYLWDADSEETSFLGTLAPAVSPEDLGDAIFNSNSGPGLWGGQGTWRNNAYPVPTTGTDGEGNEVGGDGHILVFESKAELTARDGDGRHRDAYRYDANGGTLECLSCASGSSESEPDEAPFGVDDRGEESPLGTDFGESRRWVSEDGEVVGLLTQQPLVSGDNNGVKDGYLWRKGQLARLPGVPFGASAGIPVGEVGPFLSHSGSTVAFLTVTPLLPQDGDTTADVYVARAGGGYPFPEAEGACNPGNDCRQVEASPSPPPATSVAPQLGNVPPSRCVRPARRAQNFNKRAKRGRRNARRLAGNGRRGRARALNLRAARLARAARRSSKRAKRCRALRHQRANTDRRAGK